MFANSLKKGKTFREPIFDANSQAIQRAKEISPDQVINGTIGALTSKGELVTFEAVDRIIPQLDIKQISAYTPLQGKAEFLAAMEELCFGEFKPAKKTRSIAVTGGIGGIKQAITNYTEIGDSIITSDWYWEPYGSIIEDNYRKLITFKFFDDKRFNIESFKEVVNKTALKQNTVFVLINSPAHNPTGYSIATSEWSEIITFLNSVGRKIILFLDAAYVDFAKKEDKGLFKQLDELNSNVFTIIAYSISKSLAKYGMRAATLIGIHEDQSVLEEFFNVVVISNRSTFGCVPSIGQFLTIGLVTNKELFAEYTKELSKWKQVLSVRAEAFLKYIDPEIVTAYKNGFFVSIRSDHPIADSKKLNDENIFLVPLKKGIRVGICSIEEENLIKVAKSINHVLGRC